MFWNTEQGRYVANAWHNGKSVFLSYHDDPVHAALAHDEYARKHGLQLNFGACVSLGSMKWRIAYITPVVVLFVQLKRARCISRSQISSGTR